MVSGCCCSSGLGVAHCNHRRQKADGPNDSTNAPHIEFSITKASRQLLYVQRICLRYDNYFLVFMQTWTVTWVSFHGPLRKTTQARGCLVKPKSFCIAKLDLQQLGGP
jgi:hypothetical protein